MASYSRWGVAADTGRIAVFLKSIVSRSLWRRLPGMGHAATLAALAGGVIFGNGTDLVWIMEDMAYPENRVRPHPDDPEVPQIDYRISDELKSRRSLFRRLIRQRLRGHRMLFLSFSPTLNFGHPSGLCALALILRPRFSIPTARRMTSTISTSPMRPSCQARWG